MKTVTMLSELSRAAERYHLVIHTYSPGDGVTRYRFFKHFVDGYFSDDGVHTSLGSKAAWEFLKGVEVGYYLCKNKKATSNIAS